MLFHSSLRKELARSFGATLVVLVTIVMTMTLVRTLGQATRGSVNPQEVMMVMGYTVLGYLPTILTLCLFKYSAFVGHNLNALFGLAGVAHRIPIVQLTLPIGISFYTFATLSYTLDVYLRRAKPAQHFLDYALFVTFFPHLVAGPIMRPTELVPQFAEPRRATAHQLQFGLALIILGLFQKVVLADGFLARTHSVFFHVTRSFGRSRVGPSRGQRSGGPVEVIRPGDRVLFEADEEHWHGAAPGRRGSKPSTSASPSSR